MSASVSLAARPDSPEAVPDFSTFPLWDRGPDVAGFAVGQEFDHHWGRTLENSDNALFSSLVCSWNPLYLDAEYGRSLGQPGTVIHPMLVLCTVFGLSVEDLSESAGPFLFLTECQFTRPVLAGDTLTASSSVLGVRQSSSRPGSSVVTWRTTGHNQRGEVVVQYTRANLAMPAGGGR
ncbi:MAG: hypothetical protein JWM64_969 [Frankiales bacterium]|nr:hypothetical protein [Frankiales bacterium]